jgi:hypothetical protein
MENDAVNAGRGTLDRLAGRDLAFFSDAERFLMLWRSHEDEQNATDTGMCQQDSLLSLSATPAALPSDASSGDADVRCDVCRCHGQLRTGDARDGPGRSIPPGGAADGKVRTARCTSIGAS